jgi:hypothetical protein
MRPHSWLDRVSAVTSLFGASMPFLARHRPHGRLFAVARLAARLRHVGAYGGGACSIGLASRPARGHAGGRVDDDHRAAHASTMLDILGRTTFGRRGPGAGGRNVVFRHGLKNALIPIVTVVGVQAGYLLGGAVLTETVFAWPGVGLLMVQGILARDFPVVQGCVLVIALTFVLINLTVDLLYAWLDPRIQYD